LKTQNPQLYKVLDLLTYLENIPKEDPKQNIGAFEFSGLIYTFLGNKVKAKEYFEKTLEVSPEGIGNYNRSKLVLKYLSSIE
jgi:tetratricopeptide (TPR) repeat protein